MASIHKDPRGKSPFWYCAYTMPNGARRFKSTKEKNRDKAFEYCRTLERASREAKGGNLTEARARELISEIVAQTSGAPLKSYSAEEWLHHWLKNKEASKSAGTLLKYRHTVDSFIEFLGVRAKRNIEHVTARDVQQFIDRHVADGKQPSTCNLALKNLRIPFNAARRHGLLVHNPADAVEPFATKGGSVKRPFDVEQIAALVQAAAGDWRGAILLAYYTGARLQDVANMRWESVDLENQLISFRAGKTDRWVTIPMHDALHEFLIELPAPDSAKVFLFPSLANRRAGGKSGLSMTFNRIMEKARVSGEVGRKAKGEHGRRVNTLSFHSLRHSFNSVMANGGVAQEIRQKFTGHSSAAMNKHYTHHELAPLRAAISVIPSLRSRPARR